MGLRDAYSTYQSTAYVYGLMTGVQAYFDIFGAKLNPYVLYYRDFSDPCQTYTTSAEGDTGPGYGTCAEKGPRSIELQGSFLTYGINLGIFNLSFNAYSHVKKDSSLKSIDVDNYSFAYTINF